MSGVDLIQFCEHRELSLSAFAKAVRSMASDHLSAHKSITRITGFFPNTATDLRNGTFFDENLRLSGETGAELLTVVLTKLEQGSQLKRRRSKVHQRAFERRVDCVLSNGLRAAHFRAAPDVAYFGKSNAYSSASTWLSGRSLRHTLLELSRVGLVEIVAGKWKAGFESWGGHASTYRFETELIELCERLGVDQQHIRRQSLPRHSLIRLRETKGSSQWVKFVPDDQTEQWCDLLEAYNRFVEQSELSLAISQLQEQRLIESINSRRAEANREPEVTRFEQFNDQLYRVFNDGTFEHGGRLYGGWWQEVPGWLRQHIVIEDRPTVELDYAGMLVRMLYHREGRDYRSDPYAIPYIQALACELGQSPNHYRPSIKKLFQALLNAEKGGKSAEKITLAQSFHPYMTRRQVREKIEQHHPEIAHHFGSGIGKIGQRLDSDLALGIITNLMEAGILALPIHDSFVVQQDHEDRLRSAMNDQYVQRFGFEPVIDRN